MPRLVVIGIDGMDPYMCEKYKAEMPNLSSIMETGLFKHCSSVFPPDSIPAWVTIYTGEPPETHGWLDNIDYEDIRKGVDLNKLCDLQGKTFWDQLGKAGKRVCIINPLMAYPVWPVNGIMVNGPVFITGEKQIYPPDLSTQYELPELGGMTEFPTDDTLPQFLAAALQSTQNLAKFGFNILGAEKWDLFFISFFTLDRVQHFLWRFCDTSDPLYPGPTNLSDSILQAYKTFDNIIGEFLHRIENDTGLIVLSDHGHGQRPIMLFNLNEWLRQNHWLVTYQGEKKSGSVLKVIEIAKNTSIRLVARVLGERWLYRIGKLMPKRMRKSLKASSYLIDKKNSVAWASEMGGGAAVGGIVVNQNIDKQGQCYKETITSLLESLMQYNPGIDSQLIQWAKDGGEDNHYPDIIFELNQRYSVGRSLYCPIIEKSSRHQIISGGHRQEGVLFALNFRGQAANTNSVSDISKRIVDYVLSQTA
jgi:predicted AlkP superfamily phosphohydrolase/phosphomutase